MREILDDLTRWSNEPQAIAVATVIQTWGSAPRGVGSKMALTPAGNLSGSVSGGCVETSVFEAGLEVIETSTPQLLHFGVADETAWEVGLACGGTIEVFVEKLTEPVLQFWRKVVAQELAAAVATVIRGNAAWLGKKMLLNELGETSGDDLPFALPQLKAALETGQSSRQTIPSPPHSLTASSNELEFFIEAHIPAPQLICIGAGHISIALTQIAKIVGYRTTVIDPRTAFANTERFPHVDRLMAQWPNDAMKQVPLSRGTAIAALTHDPKIDDIALIAALNSNAFYIGALGSKKTHAQRIERLKAAGLSDAALARIHAPIGLDIGARTPEEIALAVMAEIVGGGRGTGDRGQRTEDGRR